MHTVSTLMSASSEQASQVGMGVYKAASYAFLQLKPWQ